MNFEENIGDSIFVKKNEKECYGFLLTYNNNEPWLRIWVLTNKQRFDKIPNVYKINVDYNTIFSTIKLVLFEKTAFKHQYNEDDIIIHDI